MMTCGDWMTLGWVLAIAMLVLAAVAIFAYARRRPSGPTRGAEDPRWEPLEQARMRYARGEIDRETYITIRDDLQPPAASA